MYDNAVNTIDTISYKHSTEYPIYNTAIELKFKKFRVLKIVIMYDDENEYDDHSVYLNSGYTGDDDTCGINDDDICDLTII